MKKIGKSKITQGGGRIHQCIDKKGATPVEHSSVLWRQFYAPNQATRIRRLSSANKSHLPIGDSSYQVKVDNPPSSSVGRFEKCSMCGEKVKKREMVRHKQTKHGSSIGVSRRRSYSNYQRHVTHGNNDLLVKCDKCNVEVKLSNLRNHMRRVHGVILSSK